MEVLRILKSTARFADLRAALDGRKTFLELPSGDDVAALGNFCGAAVLLPRLALKPEQIANLYAASGRKHGDLVRYLRHVHAAAPEAFQERVLAPLRDRLRYDINATLALWLEFQTTNPSCASLNAYLHALATVPFTVTNEARGKAMCALVAECTGQYISAATRAAVEKWFATTGVDPSAFKMQMSFSTVMGKEEIPLPQRRRGPKYRPSADTKDAQQKFIERSREARKKEQDFNRFGDAFARLSLGPGK